MVNIQLNVPRPDVNLELKAGRDVPPVTSVNGKTGVVVLDAEDVDAVPYEEFRSPLSKILDVTLTEDSALVVTEIGGVPLSVDELHMEVFIPSGNISNGNVQVYNGTTKIGDGYHGTVSNISNKYWFARWFKQGGIWVSECNSSLGGNHFQTVQGYWVSESQAWTSRSCIEYPKITKISVPVLPTGTSIRFFAR